jgi:hypothetical protein
VPQINPAKNLNYSTGCMGVHEFGRKYAAFNDLKYGDSIIFTAGYK